MSRPIYDNVHFDRADGSRVRVRASVTPEWAGDRGSPGYGREVEVLLISPADAAPLTPDEVEEVGDIIEDRAERARREGW